MLLMSYIVGTKSWFFQSPFNESEEEETFNDTVLLKGHSSPLFLLRNPDQKLGSFLVIFGYIADNGW